jgi:hypothetical protein
MTPKRLARLISDTFDPLSKPVAIAQLCSEILFREKIFASIEDALERAEKIENKVIANLEDIASNSSLNGIAVRFSINSSSAYYLHGSCFALPGDSSGVVDAKKRRSHAWSYAAEIDKLTPLQFEALCCGLLALIGVENPATTRRSGDEGIDFFGRMPLPISKLHDVLGPNLSHKIYFWVVGQAKHYQRTTAGTPELRDLFGSIELAKAGVTNPIEQVLKGERVRAADPVLYLFVTSGNISSQGKLLLKSSGVYGVDGEMIGTFLSDHAVGIDSASNFSSAVFADWVASYVQPA